MLRGKVHLRLLRGIDYQTIEVAACGNRFGNPGRMVKGAIPTRGLMVVGKMRLGIIRLGIVDLIIAFLPLI